MALSGYKQFMQKPLKTIMGALSGMLVTTSALAANPTGFTFNYNVGTVITNYRAYGVAIQVWPGGVLQPQPAGTVIFGYWYVWDLGPVSGSGTVKCPPILVQKGTKASDEGILFIGSANDVGGDGTTVNWTHPVANMQVLIGKPNYDYVEIIEPDLTGIELFYGPAFSPFGWDLSPYLW